MLQWQVHRPVPARASIMLLQKTDKARLELSPGVRTLSLRERSLLLLADGKSLSDLQAMYNGIGAQIVDNLMRQGYLAGPATLPDAPSAAVAPADIAEAPKAVPQEPVAAANKPQDPSDALRSLAGTRMYLFDICERMFARRDPALAKQFHEALRGARDRASMLDVGEALLEEVAQMAGAERAQTIRDRMDQLLPREPESTTSEA
jgi:hypothetical protein